jgi:hypothetical protein
MPVADGEQPAAPLQDANMSTVRDDVSLPGWAAEVLACPVCRSGLSVDEERFICDECGPVGHQDQGIVRFRVASDDPPVALYEALGGPTLYERKDVPFTTSSLDAPVYLSYLEEVRPASLDAVIVDAGAGAGILRPGSTGVIAG